MASDGGIFAFGDAGFYGSTGGIALNRAHRGHGRHPRRLAATGWWPPTAGIFAFGDAGFYGSTGGMVLNQPVVGMAATPDGGGYWLVASDGGIFAFGDAGFYGSTGGITLNRPIVGMAATPDGGGYWLVASDGGHLRLRRRRLLRVDRQRSPSTGPSWAWPPPPTAAATGWWPPTAGIFAYGDAGFYGSTGRDDPQPAGGGHGPLAGGHGYWLVASDGGHLRLRRRRLLRLHRAAQASTNRWWAWPPPDGGDRRPDDRHRGRRPSMLPP